MLRYDRSDRRPPNYLARAEQRRVFRLMIALGLVLLLIQEIRRPRAAEMLGIFFGGKRSAEASQPQDDPQSLVATRTAAPAANAAQSAPLGAPVVDGLDGIRDNRPFRNEEIFPWYELLGVLHDAEPADLRARAARGIAAVQLLKQPEAYRARLVTIRGTARQVLRQDPLAFRPTEERLTRLIFFPELELPSLAVQAGLAHAFLSDYHRVVVQQPGASVPIVVFTLGLPEGFPKGTTIREPVAVNGYFFKNWLFSADDGLGLGPVVLAKQIEWEARPTPEAEVDRVDPVQLAGTVVSALLVAGATTVWLMRRSRAARPLVGRGRADEAVPDFSAIPEERE